MGLGRSCCGRTPTGRARWYGKWRQDGRRGKRKLGPKRTSGTRHGFTRARASQEAREKLRLGMTVVLREASNARNLIDLLPAVDEHTAPHSAFATGCP